MTFATEGAEIVGSHPAVRQLRTFVAQVGPVAKLPVLLVGEAGTGKSLLARAVHRAGGDPAAPFRELACSALSPDSLEHEIFGRSSGAAGGTLVLDDIAALPGDAQARLLVLLGEGLLRPMDGEGTAPRLIATADTTLAARMQEGAFRRDLFYRLNVASQELPPLRRIGADVPELARHLLARAAARLERPAPEIGGEMMGQLRRHSWPGNTRELRGVVERALIFGSGGVLRLHASLDGAGTAAGASVLPMGLSLAEVERRYIELTLAENGGNVAAAADQLGVSRKVLWQRRKRHGLLGGR
ncbi:MAG: sigma 54-interacting transcriptional regulator [Gemmatimonadota bacterium]|nr:sigma 54-interacting transcriptional regulator [Gemmatimonadota bacterium]